MAYHSEFDNEFCQQKRIRVICGIPILPLKTSTKGPAPVQTNNDNDIVDEVLYYFKANVFFRQYDLESAADRLIVYLTLYVTQCLKDMGRITNREGAESSMALLAKSQFPLSGDGGFPLSAFFEKPDNTSDAELIRSYFIQLRHETGIRLAQRVYRKGRADKWWICFTKKKFLNLEL
ncbi:arp2/3 complex 21 kd subunit [Anaeramoeba ignava]|uniref:Actin-related protein 2/3 complex subunit 3 n=1 Tax=Anaeramoeba ignava TaxID=1746090 RepID=A0A9Q0LPQ1_ANAIG|nr:arp2/3 complex 21 kd subunit [Anaeramoeba ignava]|eukprot:Anaeramoba_ignava/c15799_g1_i2.p1 GENE.c15799_g1_i2~~c15799_g1_i2.p1  ORF type:complete len:177 (+),score=27.90 c15799_g1_i2:24-554(+)